MKEKVHHLNIYRIKQQYKKIQDITISAASPSYDLETENFDDNFKYRLFIQRNKKSRPAWYTLLQTILNQQKEADYPIMNVSTNFVLLIDVKGNLFALTGGTGYTKVQEVIDEEYGLNMALRLLADNTISNILQKPFKGETKQVWRSVVGYRPDLDLENYRRIQKAIDGKSVESTLPGITISGKTALSFNLKTTVGKFQELFEKLVIIEKKKPNFEFPKSYEVVKDDKLVDRLDGLMLSSINDYLNDKSDRDNLYLELKDPFIQFRCIKFKLFIKNKEIELSALDLDIVKKAILSKGIKNFKDINSLTSVKVSGYDESDWSLVDNESLKELMVCEMEYNKSSYIYFDRKWFKILDDLHSIVEKEIRRLPVVNIMPSWDEKLFYGVKGEHNYCDYVEKSNGWKNLDCDLVTLKGSTSIELCDLYDKIEKRFIFVKKTWGAKTSYLFNQGLVSAEHNYKSEEFRKAIQTKHPSLFDGSFDSTSKIVFAVADKKATHKEFPNNLTFFAKLNLLQVIEKLRAMQYTVEIAPIELINGKK